MAALIAAMSLSLAACGVTTSASTLPLGTVTGRVTAGPTCPVERIGYPCPPESVSAMVQARTAHGQVVASTHTDSKGRYRLQLRPGTYTLAAVTPKPLPRCSATKVTVVANHTTSASISCDTGIR